MSWSGLPEFIAANRTTLRNNVTGEAELLVKSHGHLKFYWVLDSGHSVSKVKMEKNQRNISPG